MDIKNIRQQEMFYHERFYRSYHLYEAGSWINKPVTSVIESLQVVNFKDIKVLDLGSGVGRNAIAIASEITDKSYVHCVDLLPSAIEILKENAEKYNVTNRIVAEITSIENFEFQNLYDLIIGVSTLEHVENTELLIDVLNNIKNHTSPNGVVCLIINSEISERKVDTNEILTPQFEINLKTNVLIKLIETVFDKFKILKTEVKPLKYNIERELGWVLLETIAVTHILQKNEENI